MLIIVNNAITDNMLGWLLFSAIFFSDSTFVKCFYRILFTFPLSVYANAFDLPHFQAEFIQRVLHFKARRKPEEDLGTKVTLICAAHACTHIYVCFVNMKVFPAVFSALD